MLYDSEVNVKGINTYRFVIDPANFALIDKNLPFCQPDENNCLPEGLGNVEECYGGFMRMNIIQDQTIVELCNSLYKLTFECQSCLGLLYHDVSKTILSNFKKVNDILDRLKFFN